MNILRMALGNQEAPHEGMNPSGVATRLSMFANLNTDSYSSMYPNIKAIVDEYMMVRPYATDANGLKVNNKSVISALYHPNQLDSSVEFSRKTATSTLALRNTYILVWHKEGNKSVPGGVITPDNIAGFTFLEFPTITRKNGSTTYTIGNNEYTDMEVMRLPGGVNPYDLYGGYCPSESARRWATLDDYLADYQMGFFENGAVPAGQFTIMAKDKAEYEEIVEIMESKNSGARNNNRVTYVPQPIDKNTGKPAQAQVTWTPFSTPNKDIDFSSLFKQVNDKLSTSFGVSNIIKGLDDTATYANASVADKNFAKRVVAPLLLINYTQITHELNRITGGLGYAISFDYDMPAVADEELVQEQTAQTRDNRILALKEAGFELPNIKNYLNSGDIDDLTGTATTDNDDEDIDDGGEVKNTPDPRQMDRNNRPINGTVIEATDKSDDPKDIIKDAAKKFMQSQIDSAKKELPVDQVNDDDKQQFIDDVMVAIVASMISAGTIQYSVGKQMLEDEKLSTDNLTEYSLSDNAETSYRAYLQKVASSFSYDTEESISNVLSQADIKGWSKSQLSDELDKIIDTDAWRIERLATTEMNHSESLGGVDSMTEIQSQTGIEFEKSLMHTGGTTSKSPCEFCRTMIGVWVKLDQPLVSYGQMVIGEDGGMYINDFVDNDGYDLHPNGHCTIIYRIAGGNQ